MFFRKKKIKKEKNEIAAIYYEGIDMFPTNSPCTLNVQDGNLIVKKIGHRNYGDFAT